MSAAKTKIEHFCTHLANIVSGIAHAEIRPEDAADAIMSYEEHTGYLVAIMKNAPKRSHYIFPEQEQS